MASQQSPVPASLPPMPHSQSSFDSFLSSSSSGDSLSVQTPAPREDGLRHAERRLNAKKYRSPGFLIDLCAILGHLKVPSWNAIGKIVPQDLQVHKVSGSLTNAVFFISYPGAKTVLLRIYGPFSGSLISRPRELHTLHVLSSVYNFGPVVHGTFENGRIEEFYDSTPLNVAELRDETLSRFIAARMSELHQVDISMIEGPVWELGVEKNIRSWLTPAKQVLELLEQSDCSAFNMNGFIVLWEAYWDWIQAWEALHGECRRVFAHNDAQYGNLLRLKSPACVRPPHHQIIVVDFEYASPNPAAFDIANHFHEWTTDYNSSCPWKLDFTRYPSPAERKRFYTAYLASYHGVGPSEEEVSALDREVRIWSPASHAMWAVWSLVQARDELDSDGPPEFPYVKYAHSRVDAFRQEASRLGIQVRTP